MSLPVLRRTEPATTASAQRRRRLVVGLLVALAALALVSLMSLAYGSRPVSLGTALEVVWDYDPQDSDHLAVWTVRFPRTVVGLVVGVALGLAGTLMQGVTRNPLADPGLLGVNAGAAISVVFAISVLGIGSVGGYLWFAFGGAAVASVAVFTVGSMGREGATPVKLALAGAAVTAALTSLTTAVLLSDAATFERFRFWQVGTLSGRDLGVVVRVLPFLVVGTILALAIGRLLNTLSLGEEVAAALGQRILVSRLLTGAAVVLLCGAATAIAGPIAFVGLVIPHAARAVTGPDYRWILPYSMLFAPILLLLADILGRVVAPPSEIEVGVVTALLGGPFFIALVRRRTLAEL